MMLSGFVSAAKEQARQTARNAALTIVGAVLCVVGVGFLTAALWIVLEIEYGALIAALVLGGVYLAIGGGVLAFGRQPQSGPPVAQPEPLAADPATETPPRDPWVVLAEGFATGLRAGREMRGGKR